MRKRDLVIGDPYYQAWQDYSRVWRRSLFLIIVLFYCVNFVLLWIVGTMFPMAPKWVLPISMIGKAGRCRNFWRSARPRPGRARSMMKPDTTWMTSSRAIA